MLRLLIFWALVASTAYSSDPCVVSVPAFTKLPGYGPLAGPLFYDTRAPNGHGYADDGDATLGEGCLTIDASPFRFYDADDPVGSAMQVRLVGTPVPLISNTSFLFEASLSFSQTGLMDPAVQARLEELTNDATLDPRIAYGGFWVEQAGPAGLAVGFVLSSRRLFVFHAATPDAVASPDRLRFRALVPLWADEPEPGARRTLGVAIDPVRQWASLYVDGLLVHRLFGLGVPPSSQFVVDVGPAGRSSFLNYTEPRAVFSLGHMFDSYSPCGQTVSIDNATTCAFPDPDGYLVALRDLDVYGAPRDDGTGPAFLTAVPSAEQVLLGQGGQMHLWSYRVCALDKTGYAADGQ